MESHGDHKIDLKNLRFLGPNDLLNEEDVETLCDYEDEQARKGNFKKIFPLKDNIETY